MGVIKKFNPETGKWEVYGSTEAQDINLLDVENNFTYKNVEGAMREISNKLDKTLASLDAHSDTLVDHSAKIAWLKENGGGGGGTGGGGGAAAPTITSEFEDCIVTKEEIVEIPIFFTSPNLGEGIAYVLIDGVEIATIAGIKQGNNVITVGKLTNLKNKVSIYVKDRINMLSNQLTWNITCGGIDLEVTFDDTADYYVTDLILMQFDVRSASEEPIIMHMTVDYEESEVTCDQGFNEYYFPKMGPGIHRISFYLTSGPYTTSVQTFNIVVVSTNSLYVSSSFVDKSQYPVGIPVSIQYRISKASTEEFDVKLYLNGRLSKELKCVPSTYYWTLNDLDIDTYDVKIEVSGAYDETQTLEFSFDVISSDYNPARIVETGLQYRLSARGRTNQDIDRESPYDESGNGIVTTLHNFNWFSNGWIDGELVCDSNAYVEIDFKPWESNAIYGSTIEVQFTALDIGFTDSRIFDYTDITTPYKGAYVDIEECKLNSIANEAKVSVGRDIETTVSFVIDRKNKFGKVFVNGICSRAFVLSDTGSGTSAQREDFTHSQKIYLNSKKGESCFGACKIKDVRVYGRVLSDDEIVNNYIAQIRDLREQEKAYNFNFENTSLPTIRMYGDMTNMTDQFPVNMRIKYTSPNEDKYGQSFDLPYCQVQWQGTSSIQYVLKNFTARLKDENMAPYYYSPYPNGMLEDTFCFKADYMESTHCRNVGIAKFVNECLYDTKNPMQLKDPKVRNSINGFPCIMYINDELQGVYNFNLDRYSTKSYGYTDPDKCLVYEVSANSDTTAGAFYKWTEASGKSELDYYKSDFICLYPPTRAAGNDNMSELIRLVQWVNDSSDEDFKDNFSNYFDLEYVLRYYLYVLVFGAVDSLGKNMKLATWDGLKWYPQVYDADTTIGLDNSGFLLFDMDVEMGDENTFNTTGSVLWQRIVYLFQAELKAQYALMRQGRFTVENIMKYLYGEQISQIPATLYNKDMQTKYLNFGNTFLHALHGSGEQHITKWIKERIMYCDTLLGYQASSADYITLRSSKLGEVYLDIETYIPMYVTVKWRNEANNAGQQTKRVGRGEKVRFTYNMPTATDQEIIVYAGHYIKSLGDVSNLQPTTLLISNADRLTEITCHSENLRNTDLSLCKLLQKIDLRGCTTLGEGIGAQPILDIKGCKYLRYCDCRDTKLTAIYTMQAGGNLEEIYYPESIQIVQVTNQTYLHTLGMPYGVENGKQLSCPNLSDVEITNCNALKRIHAPFNESDALTIEPLKNVQNLILQNSLGDFKYLNFKGFNKLKTIQVTGMKSLLGVGFSDLIMSFETSSLNKVTLSDCNSVNKITFNISSEEYKVAFAPGTVIDLAGMHSVKTIECNTAIKGLTTMIIPSQLKRLDFNGLFGKDSDITSVWSADAADHLIDGYVGMDLKNTDLDYLDMTGLIRVTEGMNFNLKPTTYNPNINNVRGDGKTYPFFRPQGSIDLNNFTGDITRMLKGFDLSKMDIILDNNLSYIDITGLFEYCLITSEQLSVVKDILSKFSLATKWDYVFAGATLGFPNTQIDIPTNRSMSLRGLFKDTNASTDFLIPTNVVDVREMFMNCKGMITYVNNWERTDLPNILAEECYYGTGGDLELISTDWGGYGFYPDVVSRVIITIETGDTEVVFPSGSNILSKGYIFWGDGEISKLSEVGYKHTYAQPGIYTVRGHFTFGNGSSPSATLRNVLTTVESLATNSKSLNSAFRNCAKLTSANISNLAITDLRNAFSGCRTLTDITCNNVDTSKCTSLRSAFSNCEALTTLDVNNFSTGNVTDMYGTFMSCLNLSDLDLSNWDTSKVTSFQYFCMSCTNLASISLGEDFKTDSAENMLGMFYYCQSLTELNTSRWNTGKVKTMKDMFNGCFSLTTVSTADWDTSSVTTIENIFANCYEVSEINTSNWSTELLESAKQAFSTCRRIKTLDLSKWTSTNLVDITGMCQSCEALTELKLGPDFKLDNITDISNTFNNCRSLKTLDLSNTDLKNISNASYAFYNCQSLTALDLSNNNLDNLKVADRMFAETRGLTGNIIFPSAFTASKLEDASGMFENSAITSIPAWTIDGLLKADSMFAGCSSLSSIDVSNYNTSAVTSLHRTFYGCSSLQSLDLSKWSVANVLDMSQMFYACNNIASLNLTNWDTSKVTDMSYMFATCYKLNVNPSHFKTNNVLNFDSMFLSTGGSSGLASLDLSSWDTSKATNMTSIFKNLGVESITLGSSFKTNTVTTMEGMFNNCQNLKSIDLSNFNTSAVTNMRDMFKKCISLSEINLSNFDFSNTTSTYGMFNECVADIDLSNKNFKKVTEVTNMFLNYRGLSIDMTNVDITKVTAANKFISNAASLTSLKPPMNISCNIEITAANLDVESLKAIVNNLASVSTAKTLTLGATSITRLPEEDKIIATSKGWTLA